MANAGGLFLVLVGGALGVLLAAGALSLTAYGIFGSNARRGFRAAIASMALCLVGMVLALPFWVIVLRWRDMQGQPLNVRDSMPMIGVVVVQASILCASMVGVIRQWRRRSALQH